MAERILMIDDDARLAGMVGDYLGGAGFRLTVAGTAREGEALLKRESFDAVILDLMLPDGDGLDVCRRLRGTTDVPILMLTARDAAESRITGLEAGADDYVAKPFEPRELSLRIASILKRARPAAAPPAESVRFGPFVFHIGRTELRKGEEMGWFQHGSTIIVFAPRGLSLCGNVVPGAVVRMGQPLLSLPRD